ncbi:MAG: NAD(P)-dependent oxidoreductase [Sedimentisphaerales bacterium]|nr:NAD(P)-dependent oxidoreductase [Sedimentisphaerales bacterium]
MRDERPTSENELENLLSEPEDATIAALGSVPGDIAVLGAGGKMGPTLAMMLRKAASGRTIYAVSRFSNRQVKGRIEEKGIETIEADLLDEAAWAGLPDVPNVFYLVGMKFGVTGQQPLTWAMNAYVPALAARRYRDSRIVALSTGNVYAFVDSQSGGAREEDEPGPVGEYAQSCLGRERMFQHFSNCHGTPVTLIRLNYANECRYGIIVDLTHKILHGEPVDVTMGAVNLIWQGDANNTIIRSLRFADSPPAILNVTGRETVRVRELAARIGEVLGRKPVLTGVEADSALLSNASRCVETLGAPATSLDEMVERIATWVAAGGKVLNKPTKYDVRDGRF